VLDRGSFGGADDFDQVSVLASIPVLRSLAARSSATGFVCRDTRPTSTSSFARWRRGDTSADSHWRAGRRSSTRRRELSTGLVETVGVGQMEVEIASAADTTIVVVNPGWGDAMQANKAGLLEVADIFVINKADRPGVRETRRDLDQMLELGGATSGVRRFSRPWHRRHRRRGTVDAVVNHRSFLESGQLEIVVARGCASNSTRCSRRWSVHASARWRTVMRTKHRSIRCWRHDRSLSRGHRATGGSMIATSIPYDLVFLIHIIAAVDTLIVFIVMRTSAQAIAQGALSRSSVNASPIDAIGRTRGARLADHGTDHVLDGDKSVSLSKPWIGVGILATWRSPVTLKRGRCRKSAPWPGDRARRLAPPDSGRAFLKSIDILLALIAVAFDFDAGPVLEETACPTMPAATVALVASSIRTKLPVTRFER